MRDVGGSVVSGIEVDGGATDRSFGTIAADTIFGSCGGGSRDVGGSVVSSIDTGIGGTSHWWVALFEAVGRHAIFDGLDGGGVERLSGGSVVSGIEVDERPAGVFTGFLVTIFEA